VNGAAQVLLDGLLTGASYALMAAGLALILGVVKVIDLAHGAFFTLGAYVAYALAARGVAAPAAAVPLAAGVAFAFGVFLAKSFINPVRAHPFSVAVGTLGASLLFEQAAQLVWGPLPLAMESAPPWRLAGGLVVRPHGIASLAVSSLLLGGLSLFLSSPSGLPLRLIAEDEEIAGAVGMDVERIRYLTFGAASAAAAAAGVLLAPAGALTPTMGRVPLILSLIVVIAAGMDRIPAIFALGIGLGLLSNLSAYLLGPEWSYTVLLAIIVLLLAARPSGLAAILPARDDRG